VLPFSAVRLLRSLPPERTRRRRLRDVLLFVLRVAAVLLLAASFARPYLKGTGGARPPVTVVLLDASASMGGTDRVARARALARQAVDAAPRGNAVALVRFAGQSDVLVAPVADRGAVRAAVDRFEPGAGPTQYRAGLSRAAEVIGDRGGHVVVVTDLSAGGWAGGEGGALPGGVEVEVADVGAPPGDLGLVGLAASGDGVVAQVRNTGGARQAAVTFDVNGATRATRSVPVGAEQSAELRVPLTLAPADRVRARLSDPGGLPGDDERWLVAESGARLPVEVIVSPGASQRDALYVRRALESLDGPRAADVTVRTADRVQQDGVGRNAAAVVLIGSAGLDRRGLEGLATYVRNGGGLLLAAGPGLNPEIVQAGFGDDLPRVRVRPAGDGGHRLALAETRHPALDVFTRRPGAFVDVRFARSALVLGTDRSEVIARFDTGEPALVATPFGRGRVLVFASDLANRWNDFALHPAFVPFIGEAVRWLAAEQAPPASIVAGATPLPGADVPGVISWPTRTAAAPVSVAVNADPREFDTARTSASEFVARVPRSAVPLESSGDAEARREEGSQGLWRYGLGLMLAVLVTESLAGRRT
jgi:hypothetical protein